MRVEQSERGAIVKRNKEKSIKRGNDGKGKKNRGAKGKMCNKHRRAVTFRRPWRERERSRSENIHQQQSIKSKSKFLIENPQHVERKKIFQEKSGGSRPAGKNWLLHIVSIICHGKMRRSSIKAESLFGQRIMESA